MGHPSENSAGNSGTETVFYEGLIRNWCIDDRDVRNDHSANDPRHGKQWYDNQMLRTFVKGLLMASRTSTSHERSEVKVEGVLDDQKAYAKMI